jgi:biofilm protein TabA
MIHDLLSNETLYRSLHSGFGPSFDWLKRFEPTLADGKYAIDGDRVFALVQSYVTTPPAEKRLETHVEHIDIQYVASGVETMHVAPRSELVVTSAYDPARDIAFYADSTAITTLHCGPGSFTIYFPTDGHKPGLVSGAALTMKKVVIKIKV